MADLRVDPKMYFQMYVIANNVPFLQGEVKVAACLLQMEVGQLHLASFGLKRTVTTQVIAFQRF